MEVSQQRGGHQASASAAEGEKEERKSLFSLLAGGTEQGERIAGGLCVMPLRFRKAFSDKDPLEGLSAAA
jgi:hypothetical protein